MIFRTFLTTKISTSQSTVEALNAIVSKISKRKKLIKIAGRSPAGWVTIAEYENDPFPSDSEDSKKIRQAENRALAKNKNKSSYTLSSKPDRTRRPQFRNDGFHHGFNPSPPPFPFFFPLFKPENPPFTQSQEKVPKPTDTCCGCGQTGHWRSRCPKQTKTEIDAKDIIYQEISKKYSQLNRGTDICLHSLSQVLAKARGSNTVNLYTRHFSKWQQWVSQFPNTKAIPADDTYVIAYMLNLFQKNKSYENIRISFFAIKYFQKITGYKNVLTGGLLFLVLEGIKRTSQKNIA